jgi:hypothetical protein
MMLKTISKHLIGVLAWPVIVGYWFSYRLLGVETTYRWGEIDVRPIQRVTRNQFLFSRFFPMVIAGLILLILYWTTTAQDIALLSTLK